MNFLHKILLREFPFVRIKFAADSSFYRLCLWIRGNPKDVVSVSGKYIYFLSEDQFKYMEGMQLMEVLTHEYMHLWQRKYYPLYMVKRLLFVGLTVALVCLSILLGSVGFLIVSVVPLLPIYNPWVVLFEMDAYRMSVMTRVCMWNNTRPLPKSHYDLLTPTDASLREIVNGLFSETYLMQWAPDCVREWHLKKLLKWRDICLEKYFYTRLAFESENTYICVIEEGCRTLQEPYAHVMMYFVTEGVQST